MRKFEADGLDVYELREDRRTLVASTRHELDARIIVRALNTLPVLEGIVSDYIETLESACGECIADHADDHSDDCENCSELTELMVRFGNGLVEQEE